MTLHERRRPAARTRRHAGRTLVAALVAMTLGGGPAAAAEDPARSVGPAVAPLQALALNTQLWPGTSTVVLRFWDDQGVPLDPRVTTGTLEPIDPDGVPHAPIPLAPMQLIPDGPWFATADVHLDRTGTWTLAVTTLSHGRSMATTIPLTISPDAGTLQLGSPMPDLRTPTLASSGYHLARITTDPEPEPSFYWSSVSDALAAGRPFVLAVDSLGVVTSSACGGAVGHLRHLKKEFPGLLLIHAEPWVMREQGGRLWPDPLEGPPRPAPWTAALGLASAPWILVVDDEGRVRAKLTDVFGSDELRAAVRRVAPWAPGGH
jgi:hypothetical protein